jgi:hypothetical protein
VEGAGTDLHVIRLQQSAAMAVPIILQAKDDLLKAEHLGAFRPEKENPLF